MNVHDVILNIRLQQLNCILKIDLEPFFQYIYVEYDPSNLISWFLIISAKNRFI